MAQHLFGSENFVAFYLSAGVISSFVSLLIKSRTGSMIPSLGASGAIIGLMAFIGFAMPELQVGIPFLPMRFDIKDAIWWVRFHGSSIISRSSAICADICYWQMNWHLLLANELTFIIGKCTYICYWQIRLHLSLLNVLTFIIDKCAYICYW